MTHSLSLRPVLAIYKFPWQADMMYDHMKQYTCKNNAIINIIHYAKHLLSGYEGTSLCNSHQIYSILPS